MYASPVLYRPFDEEWESATEALTKAERKAVKKAVYKGRVVTDPKLVPYVPLAAKLLRESLLAESETSSPRWFIGILIVILAVWNLLDNPDWYDWGR